MFDEIILSDLHLGGGTTRCGDLMSFFGSLPPTRKIRLLGDTFDASAGLRFPGWEVAIIAQIQKLHDGGTEVIPFPGNHDPVWDQWASILNLKPAPVQGVTISSCGQIIYMVHGHKWDTVLESHPNLTAIAIFLSRVVASGSVRLSRWLKSMDKHWRDVRGVVEEGVMKYAEPGMTVICGHTHLPVVEICDITGIRYYNTGSWCENAVPTYVTIKDGNVALQEWRI